MKYVRRSFYLIVVMSILEFNISFAAGLNNIGEQLFQVESRPVYKSFHISKSPFGLHCVGREIEEAAKTGASWNRIGIFWFRAEPTRGHYRIDKGVELINKSALAGMELAPRIISVNPWANTAKINELNRKASGSKQPMGNRAFIGFPNDIEAYKKFLTTLVERFDGDGFNDAKNLKKPIKYWQIENEWNWRWKDSPERFVEFLRIAYRTVKEADHEAKVILGGIADIRKLAFVDGYLGESVTWRGKTVRAADLRRNTRFMKNYNFIRHVLTCGGDYFNIIDFHHYGQYEYLDEAVAWLKDLMEKSGYKKPIWIMEGGGPFEDSGEKYTEEKHAQEIIKYYVAALGSGVEVFFWSSYLPTPGWNRSFLNISIVDERKRKKPAYNSYKLLTSKLKGAAKVETLSTGKDIYAFRFTKDDKGYVYVLWSDTRKEIKIPLADKKVLISDFQGQAHNVQREKNNIIIVIGEAPIFVEVY